MSKWLPVDKFNNYVHLVYQYLKSQNVAFKVVVFDNASRHLYHLGLTSLYRQVKYMPQNIKPLLSHWPCESLWHSRTITLDARSAVSRMKVGRPVCVTECWNMYSVTDHLANTQQSLHKQNSERLLEAVVWRLLAWLGFFCHVSQSLR